MEVRNKYAAGMFFLLTIATIQLAHAGATDKSVENASLLCKMLDGNDALTQASEFSAEDRSVNISVDSSPEEARELCPVISAIVEDHDMVFAQGWTVQISSAGNGYEVIAICPL
ncbi:MULTISPECIES: hypothetical protein [Pseudomonas]|uniref:DUF732 domain-containing protein n=1 Tax=Pseudomonas wuhanensis TaxID=2954098 RepID=A0ABY9GMK6_9PSED|nr:MULTISPECIES: hypothetical protein [unclassified Pseudomonas]WLI10621.1 hypothetical protein PSH65_20420 [Pseudomonas sp. FP603]WLI16435.1 hypothetical protein PSH88_19045 [Pseudomonas sp. FP607]